MKRRFLLAGLALLIVLAAALALQRAVGRPVFADPVTRLELDLAHPDALVRTHSLSQLPRDFLRIPLARDLFTEDLIFYYEEHPDRLGLLGSLRRIAYEHDLRWSDEILAWVLDQPAEIALWRGGDGRLRHWLLAMSRPALARVLQEAAGVALGDRQLRLAGRIDVDGEAVDVLALEVSAASTWLLAAKGERVLALSDPGLLLDDDDDGGDGGGDGRQLRPQAQAQLAALLSADAARRATYAHAFQLPDETPRHSVAVRTHYLSFGYQRFFPGLEALRFDFGDDGWSTHALFDTARLAPGALDGRELWAALPGEPATCALLPVDWRLGSELVTETAARPAAGTLLTALTGPAAACWYPRTRLQAPLFAATLNKARADLDPALGALFAWGVRAQSGERRAGDTVVWQRAVEVPFARLNSDGEPEPGPLTVTLARRGRYLLFSPDAARVEQALAALEKRYPSVADRLPAEALTLGVLEPRALSELARSEALVMLPRGAEPIFRGAAERLLLPRLEAFGEYPPYRLALRASAPAAGWQAVDWQELGR